MVKDMDWSKAKNILIIAFVITNIFLIYNIEKDIFDNTSAIVKEKNIEDIIDILEEKNIKVDTEIPKKILALPTLNVAYETYEQAKLDKIFSRKNQKTSIENNEDAITSSIINHKIVQYTNDNPQAHIDDFNPKTARREAEAFIKEHGFMKKDVLYWDTQESGEGYKVIFKQKYKGSFLEYSYMYVIITGSGVKEFERMWLIPLEMDEKKNDIIPATKALLKFMKEIEDTNKEMIIEDIALGYWFDPSQIGLTNVENVKSGTAVPAWRILLKDGQTKFIVAYENY
ncbi:two-component system regulatory protein YycI [Clostridiaceae bacterium 35-E11]